MSEIIQQPWRFDQLLKNAARGAVGALEKQTGVDLWNRGVGEVVHAAIERSNLAKNPANTPVGLAEQLGLLPKERKPRAKGTRVK